MQTVLNDNQEVKSHEAFQKAPVLDTSMMRFKITKVELAPIIALRDEIPLDEVTDQDNYLILNDSNPESVQIAYDSLRVLSLLPGNVVNGEDISPLPSHLAPILSQYTHNKIWMKRNVVTKIAVIVAAVSAARTAQLINTEETAPRTNFLEATPVSHSPVKDPLIPELALEKDAASDLSGTGGCAQSESDIVLNEKEVCRIPPDEKVSGSSRISEKIPDQVDAPQSMPGAARGLANLEDRLESTLAFCSSHQELDVTSLTLDAIQHYSRLCSPQNSIIWQIPNEPQRARIIGTKGINLALIQKNSGVTAVACTLRRLRDDAREIFILGSENSTLDEEETRNVALALKLYNILCRYQGIREYYYVTPLHYRSLGLPDESRLTDQEYALCHKYRQEAFQGSRDDFNRRDRLLKELLGEAAIMYKQSFQEQESSAPFMQPIEYLALPRLSPSDVNYFSDAGYLNTEEEAYEWRDLDELWNSGREVDRLRLRGSNEKALLRVGDAMRSIGMQVPYSLSDDIGPSASLVGEDSSVAPGEVKLQKPLPEWTSPENVHGLVETWTTGLPVTSPASKSVFPPEDLLYRRSSSPAAPMREVPRYEADHIVYRKSPVSVAALLVSLAVCYLLRFRVLGRASEILRIIAQRCEISVADCG
jgi:hypothetical protein